MPAKCDECAPNDGIVNAHRPLAGHIVHSYKMRLYAALARRASKDQTASVFERQA